MQFREADAALRRATLNGESKPELVRRANELREKVHSVALRADVVDGKRLRVPSASDIVDLVGSRCLVEFAEAEAGTLVAVTIAAGRVRQHEIGPMVEIRRELDSLSMALRRLAVGQTSPASQQAALAVVAEASRQLDRRIVQPLGLRDQSVVIVPTGALFAVPWALLPSLSGADLVVAPSAALWADRAATTPAQPGDACRAMPS